MSGVASLHHSSPILNVVCLVVRYVAHTEGVFYTRYITLGIFITTLCERYENENKKCFLWGFILKVIRGSHVH